MYALKQTKRHEKTIGSAITEKLWCLRKLPQDPKRYWLAEMTFKIIQGHWITNCLTDHIQFHIRVVHCCIPT